jgi:glucose-1-phosphate adenylyltransferase
VADERVLGIVLAGGAGRRLAPLTVGRPKPAVSFGGRYRLIDFALSNLVNGGCRRIFVLIPHHSPLLTRHLARAWPISGPPGSSPPGSSVTPVPAPPGGWSGSAEAICQSLPLIDDQHPHLVAVLCSDHVYRMDPRPMIGQHRASGAGVTVAAIAVPRAEATALGVIQTGPDGTAIAAFQEKPADPPTPPGRPGQAYASMGNYLFDADVLADAVRKDAADDASRHDVGGDVIPMLVGQRAAHAYDFAANQVPGATARDAGYWRDAGTLDSYFAAQMDLCAPCPALTLGNSQWPILPQAPYRPPELVRDRGRAGRETSSLISSGATVSSALVRKSVVSSGVWVGEGASVEHAVLLPNSQIGPRAVIRHTIVDENAVIPGGVQVGVDEHHDRARGLVVSPGGVTIAGRLASGEVPCGWQEGMV